MIIRTKFYDIKDKDYDAIVIGSGMGGMTVAALLAKRGKKVLVIEQHYMVGGMTHTFSRKGFTWDVGVHALGEMDHKRFPGKVMNFITDGKVKMHKYGDGDDMIYDTFNFPGFRFGLPSSYKRFKELLINDFPEEKENIVRYFQLVFELTQKSKVLFALKTMPKVIEWIVSRIFLRKTYRYAFLTAQEVVDQFFKDEKLKAIITGQWGYYGTNPKEAAFIIQALVTRHFWNGAYYPVGNSSTIAAEVIRVVQEGGGDFLCRSKVVKVLRSGSKAIGVELEGGNALYAPLIISAISAKKSWEYFLSDFKLSESVKKLTPTPCHICLYLGFEGDIKSTEASESNQWFYESWSYDDMVWDPSDLN